MRFRIFACFLMIGALAAPAVQAGQMNLIANIVDRWSSDFGMSGLPIVLDGGEPALGQPGNYEIEVSFTAVAEGNDKGWLSTAFSAQPSGPGLTLVTGTWSGNNPMVDINGAPPPGANTPHYSVNQDAGDGTDLQNIVASLASSSLPNDHAFDKRNEAGTPDAFPVIRLADGSTALGRFFVHWDGVASADLNLGGHTFIFSQLPSGPGPEQTGAGDSIGFGGGGGPMFMVDDLTLTSGRLAGSLVTGGPLPTNDSDEPDTVNWSLVSFSGPGGAVLGATVNPTTGVFSWQSESSSPLGTYNATIQGVNDSGTPAGTDSGVLSFRLVPEPATFSLLGLAMVGALGFIRRR